ncbi:MAG: tetratricopeptide repeat protein [Myxococcales bacterium]|nr:tetratricopeptide repeat protein [Myxococcales bacterium]
MRTFLAVGLVLLLVGCISEKRASRASAKAQLGVAYLNERNPEGAVATLRGAVKLDPRNWHAHNALAMAYAAKGEAALAEGAFKDALRINADAGEILVNYGAFLVTVGRPAEAIGVLEHGLTDLEYRNPARILSNLSRAHLDVGNVDKAIARAEDALRRSPKMCPARFHLGLAHEKQGRMDQALRDYATLTDDCPQEAIGGYLRTGCILASMGDFDGASASLRHVTDAALDGPMLDEARTCIARSGG